jgi:hypothetical protein
VSDNLFWQDTFPKERRIELVASLLYSGDPNARIPNDEGLRPDRKDDFYSVVGFANAEDFRRRIEGVRMKYRYGNGPVDFEASRVLPSEDLFERSHAVEQSEMSGAEPMIAEVPVVETQKPKARRPRAPRVLVHEQPIVPLPVRRGELAEEARVKEGSVIESISSTADVLPLFEHASAEEVVPAPRAEDRISAFARGIRDWLGLELRTVEDVEVAGDVADPQRMREVVVELFPKEFGVNGDLGDIENDPKVRAHVQAANRLERAIATSRALNEKNRKAMSERLNVLRETYRGQMKEIARSRSGEVQGSVDEIIATQEQSGAHSALHILAAQRAPAAERLAGFREQVEYAAVQNGGGETVAFIDDAFRDAWQNAWGEQSLRQGALVHPGMNVVEALSALGAESANLGPLEESLPRLRALEHDPDSGIASLVLSARLSIQEGIDPALRAAERAMKRAA